MSHELILAVYHVVFPLAWAVIYGLGIVASRALWKKTQNTGPLLLFCGTLGNILNQIAKLVFNLLLTKLLELGKLNSESMNLFYLSSAFCGVVFNALVFTGIFLIAKEFRAHLDHQKISQVFPKTS